MGHNFGATAGAMRRMEMMKLPCCLPTNSNLAVLSAPPLDSARAEGPPTRSATSGERLWASRRRGARLPLTRTVIARCSPGASGS